MLQFCTQVHRKHHEATVQGNKPLRSEFAIRQARFNFLLYAISTLPQVCTMATSLPSVSDCTIVFVHNTY